MRVEYTSVLLIRCKAYTHTWQYYVFNHKQATKNIKQNKKETTCSYTKCTEGNKADTCCCKNNNHDQLSSTPWTAVRPRQTRCGLYPLQVSEMGVPRSTVHTRLGPQYNRLQVFHASRVIGDICVTVLFHVPLLIVAATGSG